MERRGSGFKKILEDYRNQPHYTENLEPEFLSEYDAFFLTLKNLNWVAGEENVEKCSGENNKETDEISPEINQKLTRNYPETNRKPLKSYSETVQKLIEIVKDNPSISATELSEAMGITKAGAKYYLQSLREQGVIEHKGPNKGGYWQVVIEKEFEY